MTASETPTMMMDRLSDAVWVMLADHAPRAMHIDDVADAAGVAPAAARTPQLRARALLVQFPRRLV